MTQSGDVNVKSSAVKIILERAMSDAYLPIIINACRNDQPVEDRSNALTTLQLLTRRERNKPGLLGAGALNVLVEALKCTEPDMKETTKRYVAVAICDLIQGNDINKYAVIDLGVLDPVKTILTSTDIRNNELKYWTLMILYQVSLSDPFPKVLIRNGFIGLIAKMARMTYGNTNMPKFCMQSLVRILANVNSTESKTILIELLDYHIVDLISICLRGEDVELIYWASGLMHEFVLKDIAADEFRRIKGVHNILASLLSAEEMYISRIVLRTVKFMAYGQDKFKQEMIHSGMVKKIMHCLTLDDDDVRYWAILCIHTVSGQVESHSGILGAPEIEILLQLGVSRKVHVAIFVSDILSLICCMPTNTEGMAPHIDSIVTTLNSLLMWEEREVQQNAAGAIFNIASLKKDFADKVLEVCFANIMSVCVTSNFERVQLTCAKAIVMLTIKFSDDPAISTRVALKVLESLIKTTTNIAQSILPTVMIQALVQEAKKGVFVMTALDYHSNQDQPPAESYGIFEPDYINVNSSGTITNASRLEEMLQNTTSFDERLEGGLEDPRLQPVDRSSTPHMDNPLNDEFLYEGASHGRDNLKSFELSVEARRRIGGALTALKIMLENNQLVRQISETHIDALEDTDQNQSHKHQHVKDLLSDSMREFIKDLVFMSLYPVLEIWALRHGPSLDADRIDENTARDSYRELLVWIRDSMRVDQKITAITPATTSASFKHSSDSSSEYSDDNIDIVDHRAKRKKGVYRHHSPSFDESHVTKIYTGLTTRSLMTLKSLLRFDSARIYLVQEMNIVEVLLYLFESSHSLSEHILACIGVLVNSDYRTLCVSTISVQTLMVVFWKHLLFSLNHKRSFASYARLVMAYGAHATQPRDRETHTIGFAEIDMNSRTPFCLVNPSCKLSVRNESWTFETICCTESTPVFRDTPNSQERYCFEVVLDTDGLMQVGWVSDAFEMDPEGGTGVGDDDFSYGYDGCRAKKWHGRSSAYRTSYGQTWAAKDIITCAIDLNLGELRYYRNGVDMGVAFTELDTSQSWYPAASLSTGQSLTFKFGGPLDRLKYMPEGYKSISVLAQASGSSYMELPPPQISARLYTEASVSHLSDFGVSKSDPDTSVELTDQGNVEPNLRPIDGLDFWNSSAAQDNIDEPLSRSIFTLPKASHRLFSRQPSKEDLRNLPSLYFEIALAFSQSEEDFMDCSLEGQDNSEEEIMETWAGHSVITIGFRGLSPIQVRLKYHPGTQQAIVCQGQYGRTMPFNINIQDGDVVGMFYIEEMERIGITVNGESMLVVHLDRETGFRPFMPYEHGAAKSYINYGDRPYRWQRASAISLKEKSCRYLNRILGY
ncbi:armadillo-type protein [Phycomyces nitens]|nr:armadillo-type protein [Phycomyces nitens]